MAKDLIKLILSKEELKQCNFKSLKVEKNPSKTKKMDLVLSFCLKKFSKKQIRILILLEHKSGYSKNYYKQLLSYQTSLYEESKQATVLIPVLFYHGKTPWKHKSRFQKAILGEFFSKIPPTFRKSMLNYDLRVIDTKNSKNKRLREFFNDRSSKTNWVLRTLDKNWILRNNEKELKKLSFGIFENFKTEDELVIFSEYLGSVGVSFRSWKKLEKEAINKGLLTKGGLMDIKEEIRIEGRQEGWKKGLQAGRMEVILNMLRENTDIAFISKVTGWPAKKIKKLKNSSNKKIS